MLCIVLFALVKYLYPKKFQEFILLPFSTKYFIVEGKNKNIGAPFSLVLTITQLIVFSLFLNQFLILYNPQFETITFLFYKILGCLLLFTLAKVGLEKLIGYVFSVQPMITSYIFQKLSYKNFIALIVFCTNLIFFYIYSPPLLFQKVYIGILLTLYCILLFYSYKSYRKAILNHSFYFILYLCALEFSPLIILFSLVLV